MDLQLRSYKDLAVTPESFSSRVLSLLRLVTSCNWDSLHKRWRRVEDLHCSSALISTISHASTSGIISNQPYIYELFILELDDAKYTISGSLTA
jgi:hypothetical protein